MIKAYRREALSDVHLYGEMHRFLPDCAGGAVHALGARGKPPGADGGDDQDGLKRTIKVLFDLLTVRFLGDDLTKPIYFFGKLAMLTMLIFFLWVGVAIVQKLG